MTRFPGTPGTAPRRRATPDVYSAMLIISAIFLLIGLIVVCYDLFSTYGLNFGQLFSGVTLS